MASHPEFAFLLDEKLAQSPETLSGSCAARTGIATAALWSLPAPAALPSRPGKRIRHPWRRSSESSSGRDPCDRASRRAELPRRLTAKQRAALGELQRLGGVDLGPSFSDGQLRRLFRALAKRFHPDRYHGSSPSERERLAATFATVVDAYRELAGHLGRQPGAGR